jgi:hypothetical protein
MLEFAAIFCYFYYQLLEPVILFMIHIALGLSYIQPIRTVASYEGEHYKTILTILTIGNVKWSNSLPVIGQ